ncbi:hypothetical protein R9C00_04020 [Flammeovirgaceae bacterium SG7u.111]|nr:hypothetical protein [Flammeovirgaceae bacterium SG7u.132]WPO36613.1 hypothetical protein R9C00_04020 [Flammeovirgaceae bacterium SG7u.111]
MKKICTLAIASILAIFSISSCSDVRSNQPQAAPPSFDSLTATNFNVDVSWPQQLPNSWILGEVPGLTIDKNDHVWILQRPNSLDGRELGASGNSPQKECCAPAPSVIEFDTEGKVVRAWNIFEGEETDDPDQLWAGKEHGIYVDNNDFVWIADAKGHTILKLTKEGKILLTIGISGETNGSNDTTRLGGPADVAVDVEANEVYVADGYINRRVIVFDSNTGEYKRHWGAYGEKPHDNELPAPTASNEPIRSFRTAVHAVTLSAAGNVYVADRTNNRIQVFKKDGTFIREVFIASGGSIWDIEFSRDPEQTYMYVADGGNMKVWVLDHETLEIVDSFGHGGRNSGQFGWVHSLAINSKGVIYTSEVKPGKRVQKFVPTDGKEEL